MYYLFAAADECLIMDVGFLIGFQETGDIAQSLDNSSFNIHNSALIRYFCTKPNNMFAKGFVRLNWISLVLIYLVVIAGSFVRITGSGMGCPDWPKCFGQWVPPTGEQQLPKDYREIYGEKRVKKVEKFAKFLSAIGMKETAEKIKNDPATYEELPFNAGKTWTEYVNRLCGFLAGNAVLLIFLWALFRYRKHRTLLLLAALNLVILTIQAWFGSIVVATNLVPWTITVHLFLALVIIALQIIIIRKVSPVEQQQIRFSTGMKWLVLIVFGITAYQMFLGTQVREYIDVLTKQGLGRESWTSQLGIAFLIHRSFSWLVLGLMTLMLWINWRQKGHRSVYWTYGVLALELISGVCLAYADMPGLVQTSHLVFASVLFGILFMQVIRTRKLRNFTL
jgi:heme a synthase